MLHDICRLVVCGLLLALAGGAEAATVAYDPSRLDEPGPYIGAGFGSIEYVEAAYSSDQLDYIYLSGGWRFNRFLTLEARLGTDSPGGCNCYTFGAPLDLRVRSLYGVYVRGTLPLTRHLGLYAVAGYSSLALDADPYLAAAHSNASSASYGAGASWLFGSGLALDLEMQPRLAAATGWRSNAVSLGFRYQFNYGR